MTYTNCHSPNSVSAVSLLLWAVVMLPGEPVQAQTQVYFEAAWEHQWQCENVRESCRLQLDLGELGEARFAASPRSKVSFELQVRKDIFAPGALQVTRYAPAWVPAQPATPQSLGQITHIQGGGAMARGGIAQDMLWALRQGNHLRLRATAAHNSAAWVTIDIKAAGLPAVIEEFLNCAHTPVNVSWRELARTRVSFAVGEHTLSADARAVLAPVISYVRQDPTVTQVFVDGHADASGDKQSNYRLSKRRAESVASFLRQHGLGDREIIVRFHGAAYPVGKNRFKRGKAMNRRTTVRLQRAAEDLLAIK